MQVYLGIDCGSSSCYFFGKTDTGKTVIDRRITTSLSSLSETVRNLPGEVHVNLEASEMTAPIRNALLPHAASVTVSHPTTNAWISRDRQKCDRTDARKLSSQLRLGEVHEVYYTDDERMRELRRLVQHYQRMTSHVIRVKNQIKSYYRQEGIFELGSDVFDVEEGIRYVARVGAEDLRQILHQLYGMLERSREIREEAKTVMIRAGQCLEIVERLMEAPGVGPVNACTLVGYIQDPHRFANKRKVIRYCGLAVTHTTSDGTPLGYARVERQCRVPALKDATYKIFMGALRTNDPNRFQEYYHRQLASGKPTTHARLNTQRYIVTCLWTMWKNGERYMD